jgi:hypothetical protein
MRFDCGQNIRWNTFFRVGDIREDDIGQESTASDAESD